MNLYRVWIKLDRHNMSKKCCDIAFFFNRHTWDLPRSSHLPAQGVWSTGSTHGVVGTTTRKCIVQPKQHEWEYVALLNNFNKSL